MLGKYENIFENIDTGGISSAINNFIESLNDVNYESSGCFMMATNAKYDSTFNEGVDYLKNTDIQGMIDICEKCMSSVVQKIIEFNEYYKGTYLNIYQSYVNAYNTLQDTPEKIKKTTHGTDEAGNPYEKTEYDDNPDYAKAKDALDSAEKALKTANEYLENQEKMIQSVTFS